MLLGWPIKEQMPWVVRLHKRGVFDVEGVCREAWMQGCPKRQTIRPKPKPETPGSTHVILAYGHRSLAMREGKKEPREGKTPKPLIKSQGLGFRVYRMKGLGFKVYRMKG